MSGSDAYDAPFVQILTADARSSFSRATSTVQSLEQQDSNRPLRTPSPTTVPTTPPWISTFSANCLHVPEQALVMGESDVISLRRSEGEPQSASSTGQTSDPLIISRGHLPKACGPRSKSPPRRPSTPGPRRRCSRPTARSPTWAPTHAGRSSSIRATTARPVTVAIAAASLSALANLQSGSSRCVQPLRTDRRNQSFLAEHDWYKPSSQVTMLREKRSWTTRQTRRRLGSNERSPMLGSVRALPDPRLRAPRQTTRVVRTTKHTKETTT